MENGMNKVYAPKRIEKNGRIYGIMKRHLQQQMITASLNIML